jgi:hypothetical protein
MGRAAGFICLLIAVGVGLYLYSKSGSSATSAAGTTSAKAAIDVTGVKNDLIAMAEAEKRHFASEGKYVTIEELRSNGDISMAKDRRGDYSYSSDVSSNSFKITASYSGPDASAPKQLSIDETMQISSQ